MFTSALNERSRSNPLCDFRLGTVATSDHETPLTESEVKPGSVKLDLVGAGGDRIEHIGQKTVGCVTRTREGATATALGGQLGVESTGGSVHGLWCFIIPMSAPQVGPAVRKLRVK